MKKMNNIENFKEVKNKNNKNLLINKIKKNSLRNLFKLIIIMNNKSYKKNN